MAKNSSWPVTGLRSRGPLKDMKDSKLILIESKLFPWSSSISLVPFRTFRVPLFPKTETGQELFFCRFLQQTGSTQNFLLIRSKKLQKLPSSCFEGNSSGILIGKANDITDFPAASECLKIPTVLTQNEIFRECELGM